MLCYELQKSVQTTFDEYWTDLVVKHLHQQQILTETRLLTVSLDKKTLQLGTMEAVQVMTLAWPVKFLKQTSDIIASVKHSRVLILNLGIQLNHIEKMDHKATHDMLRKASLDFKQQRAQQQNKNLKINRLRKAQHTKVTLDSPSIQINQLIVIRWQMKLM